MDAPARGRLILNPPLIDWRAAPLDLGLCVCAIVVHEVTTRLGVVERDVLVTRDRAAAVVTHSRRGLAKELEPPATVADPAEVDAEVAVLVAELTGPICRVRSPSHSSYCRRC